MSNYQQYQHVDSIQDLKEFQAALHVPSTGAQEALDFIRKHRGAKSYDLELVKPLLIAAGKEVDEYRANLVEAAKEAEEKKIADMKAQKEKMVKAKTFFVEEVEPKLDEMIKTLEIFTYDKCGWGSSNAPQQIKDLKSNFTQSMEKY